MHILIYFLPPHRHNSEPSTKNSKLRPLSSGLVAKAEIHRCLAERATSHEIIAASGSTSERTKSLKSLIKKTMLLEALY